MVRAMSIAEKVNVTTGTGWQMGLCVGNTGTSLLLTQIIIAYINPIDAHRTRRKGQISLALSTRWPTRLKIRTKHYSISRGYHHRCYVEQGADAIAWVRYRK